MKKSQSFPLQEKMSRLEAIEQYFQQPDINLEEALVQHQEALKLAEEIKTYLATAEQSLEQIDIANIRRENNAEA
jgi:exodeoxyribonuclease VII small subunit